MGGDGRATDLPDVEDVVDLPADLVLVQNQVAVTPIEVAHPLSVNGGHLIVLYPPYLMVAPGHVKIWPSFQCARIFGF